jgi:hypothetical protein
MSTNYNLSGERALRDMPMNGLGFPYGLRSAGDSRSTGRAASFACFSNSRALKIRDKNRRFDGQVSENIRSG